MNWSCPNCDHTHVSKEKRPHTPFHNCKGLALLSTPMVVDGTKCKIITTEREDYVGGELIQTNAEGRPIMNAITVRDDGQDCTVYAPTATGIGA